MNDLPDFHGRRGFLKAGALAFPGALLASHTNVAGAEPVKKLFSAVGISAPLDQAAALKERGAEFLTVGTGDFLVPHQPDAVFARNLAKLEASPLPILACNGFICAKNLLCVGPEANHDQVLEWSDTVFRRLKQASGKFIVFGSAGARRVPDGWPREKADTQFVSLLKRMGPLAEKHGVSVVVEQLQESECNYINRIAECAKLIRATGHPNIRLLADLYHMAVMRDTPADLKAAMDVVAHIEIAEKRGRTYPGVGGDDFRPYFRILREAGYRGAISIEGNGTTEQVGPAFTEILKQAAGYFQQRPSGR
jgi:sugar phosphate isomerase/epimerase